MPSQVGKDALRALGRELSTLGGGRFGAVIMGRLKNENPQYAFLGNGYLDLFQEKFGPEARVMARDVIAVCYRLIELSEKYPDKDFFLSRTLLADPQLEGTTDAILSAQEETEELMKKLMLHRQE